MSPFEHRSAGRSGRVAALVLGIWLAVLLLWRAVDMAPVIGALLLLPTLPAALDFAKDRHAMLRLTGETLSWRSGRSGRSGFMAGDVALDRLDHVRFETRLDLSVRVRLVLDTGKRITLPQDCVPPRAAFQDALEARGLRSERHHFALLS